MGAPASLENSIHLVKESEKQSEPEKPKSKI